MRTSGDGYHRSLPRRVTYDLSRQAARMAGVAFFGIRVTGRQHYPAAGGALVCANHQSTLDPILVGLTCDRRLNYLARDDLFHSRALGWLIRWYDAIPIQRDGMGLGGLKETLRRLRGGEMVLIFPEGTRTGDGRLQPLKSGFCMLARRARVPLVPVGLDGAYQAWPRQSRWPQPSRVAVHVGLPLMPDEYLHGTDEQLVTELAERIRRSFLQARCLRRSLS